MKNYKPHLCWCQSSFSKSVLVTIAMTFVPNLVNCSYFIMDECMKKSTYIQHLRNMWALTTKKYIESTCGQYLHLMCTSFFDAYKTARKPLLSTKFNLSWYFHFLYYLLKDIWHKLENYLAIRKHFSWGFYKLSKTELSNVITIYPSLAILPLLIELNLNKVLPLLVMVMDECMKSVESKVWGC
jgi:hypothetical protein